MQVSSPPLRPLSAPPKSNRLNRDSFNVSGTSGFSTWCEQAESECLNQTPLYGSDVTLVPSDVNNESFSSLPSGSDCGVTSGAETEELANAPSAVSSAGHTTLGSKLSDGDIAAHLKEYDDSHGRWRPQWPVPKPKTGGNWRPESPVSGGSSQYVAVPPNSAIQVDGGSDVPTSSRTNPPISRNLENRDDFPLLPKAQKLCVTTGTEALKTIIQYTYDSAKPSMTWAERLKATIASPSGKRSLDTPTGLRDLGAVPRNSAILTAEPSQQADSREVSERTKLQRIPISFPCTLGSVSPRRALLPIEWQVAAPSSSPATIPKSDSSLNDSPPSAQPSECPTRTYPSINISQGAANRTDISINKASQTITASSAKATRAPDPINAPEQLVTATQHEKHPVSASSRSSLTPSLLSATSAPFIPRTTMIARSDPSKRPSYAEVASLRLPTVPCTPTTPSSGSAAFFSAPQTPEHSAMGAKGALVGETAVRNLKIAAAAKQVPTTPLKIQAGIEEEAVGSSQRIVENQPLPEHQIPLSRFNSHNRGKKAKKWSGRRRKHKGDSSTAPRHAESLYRQPDSITPISYHFVGTTWSRSQLDSAPLTPLSFEDSKAYGHGIPNDIGREVVLTTGPLQGTPQMYEYTYTKVANAAPCSKIIIVIAAEHVGLYCPACDLKLTG